MAPPAPSFKGGGGGFQPSYVHSSSKLELRPVKAWFKQYKSIFGRSGHVFSPVTPGVNRWTVTSVVGLCSWTVVLFQGVFCLSPDEWRRCSVAPLKTELLVKRFNRSLCTEGERLISLIKADGESRDQYINEWSMSLSWRAEWKDENELKSWGGGGVKMAGDRLEDLLLTLLFYSSAVDLPNSAEGFSSSRPPPQSSTEFYLGFFFLLHSFALIFALFSFCTNRSCWWGVPTLTMKTIWTRCDDTSVLTNQ